MTLVAALLVGVGVFAVVLGVRARDARRLRDLRGVLETSYLEDRPADDANATELRNLLARSGDATERALGGSGLLARVRATLERSDWTIEAGELVALSAALAAGGLALGTVSGGIGLGLLLAVPAAVAPYALVSRSVRRRRAAFDDQFPEVLDLIAAGLESGSGISQALELVVAEADEPSATEFARVLSATRLGTPLIEALDIMAQRLDSADLRYTVQAITVQQRTGGRLAEVLQVVADFMRARAELRREVRALTAEGRLSAYILIALPFVLVLLIRLLNPDYLTPLFTTAAGIAMLVVAGGLMTLSYFLMTRIVRIEV